MSSNIQNTPNRAAFDVRSTQDLRSQMQKSPEQGLKAAAQQFEAMFLQMVLKSMRDATPQDGMLDSDASRFYTGLLDQQLAQNMAGSKNGLGFARLIEQQLGRQMQGSDGQAGVERAAKAAGDALPLSATDAAHLRHVPIHGQLPTSAAYPNEQQPSESRAKGAVDLGSAMPRDFVGQVWPHAVEASRSTGIPPQFLLAHSALESGWGRSELRRADGSSSYNLFGIKAGADWRGDTVEVPTTEYINGRPQQMVQRFRAYGSYEEAFRDYAGLLRGNPRYAAVIGSQDGAEFAKQLQQAGYATDPAYADKLVRIINGPTLRQALIG